MRLCAALLPLRLLVASPVETRYTQPQQSQRQRSATEKAPGLRRAMTEGARHTDFFISYTSADRTWAEWIAWQLEQAGYSVIIQAWDFQAGSNFVLEMDTAARTAERTIAILSPAYFKSDFTPSEWAAAFRRDPKGEQYALVPVRIRPFEAKGLLGSIVYIDLVGHDEQTARTLLLAGVRGERAKPAAAPSYPLGPSPGAERPVFPGALPTRWNVPYPRNPFFTGREDLLMQLSTALKSGSATASTQPQAISGLGGIGKTQLALEYAYQFHTDYQAVFWVRADTRENLIADFVSIARLLKLPEQDAQEQLLAVAAVKEWLRTRGQWLLILDNADSLQLVRDFLPPAFGGHLLLTTRAQSMGRLAHSLPVEKLEPPVGALFVLQRAGILPPSATWEQAAPSEREAALAIVREMDGLPLALDQAAAYMEEAPYSAADYLRLYRRQRATLLQRRGGLVPDHPASVATTWRLAFTQVEQTNPAAADLLRLCAFLHAEAIPEELLTAGASKLGPALQAAVTDEVAFNEAIGALRDYSLVQREVSKHTLSLHRLVQAVLKDAMDKKTQRRWAARTVRAVAKALPPVEFGQWTQWERLLPHALTCAVLIEQSKMSFPEAAKLLKFTGWYLAERARYGEAEPLLQRALAINEQQQGAEHLDTGSSAATLAWLYERQGKYTEAEPLYQRALAIREQRLGPLHPDTASSLNNLALLYQSQSKYAEAEPLYQRALAIREQRLGPLHPDTRIVRANYADYLRSLHREAEARQLETRSAESSQQP